MDLELLKKNSIVEKDGRYMPLVFLDLPAGVCAAATATAAKQLSNHFSEHKERKSSVSPVLNHTRCLTLQPLPLTSRRLVSMQNSIDDIISF